MLSKRRAAPRSSSRASIRRLAKEGYDPEFGARPLARTIQRLVENELSRLVLSGEVEPADKVQVEADGDELKFDVERGAASQEVTGWSEESEAAQTQEHAAAR